MTTRIQVVRNQPDMPVTTEDMLLFARMDGTDDEGLFDDAIGAAVDLFEKTSNCLVTPCTVTAVMDSFPLLGVLTAGVARSFELMRGPVSAVTSIHYLDPQGNNQTFAQGSSGWTFDAIGGRILLGSGLNSFPATFNGPAGVTTVYTAGYAQDAAPSLLIQCLKILALHFYENRDATQDAQMSKIPLSAESIMSRFTVPEFL